MANNKKIKGLTVEIGGDSTKLGKALDDSKKKSKSLQTELRQVEKLLKMDPGNVELLAQKQKILTDQVDETRKRLTLMKEEQEKVNQLYKNGEIGEADYRKYQREVEQTRLDLEKLEGQLKETGDKFSEVQRKSGAVNFRNAEDKAAHLKGVIKDMADSAVENMEKVSKKAETVGDGLAKVGSVLNKGSAVAGAALGASTKFAMDFEDAMAKVSTIADENEVPMDKMREQILALSNETGIAATDIAENVYNAISAGQKTGDAVNFVAKSLSLSKAGFADTGAALDVLTTIMNAYGMSAEEVGEISDILIQTQNLGKVTVGELASSMGKVIPTANQYGVSLDQLAAAYSITTAKGIAAAESTTYINSMLNELGKADGKASKALKEGTGKTFTELMGEGKSLSDVLAILQENAVKNNLSLGDMFGSAEAAKAASTLLGDSASVFNDRLKEMNGSTGATDKALGKLKTTSTETKKIVNELKNAGIDLGDEVLKQAAPLLKDVMGGVKNLTSWLKKLKPEQKEQLTKALEIIAVIGPGVTILGKLTKGVGSFVGTGAKLIKTLKEATIAQEGLNIAQNANPVGIYALAIAALIGAFVGLKKASEDYQESVWSTSESKKYTDAVDTATAKIKEKSDAIVETTRGTLEALDKQFENTSTITEYQKKLNELLEKAELTPEEEAQLNTIVKYFSDNVDGFSETWNKYTLRDGSGKIKLNADLQLVQQEINNTIEAFKKMAHEKLLQEQYRSVFENMVSARGEVQSSQAAQSALRKRFESRLKEIGLSESEFEKILSASGDNFTTVLSRFPDIVKATGLDDASYRELRKMRESYNQYSREIATASANLRIAEEQEKDILGVQAVLNGTYSDAAAVMMAYNAGMITTEQVEQSRWKTVENLQKAAAETGKNTVLGVGQDMDELAQELYSGQKTAEESLNERLAINKKYMGDTAKGATEAVKEEKERFKSAVGDTLASGRQEFDAQKPDYRQDAKDLGQEVKEGMGSVDLKETGGNVVLGFLKGMWNNSIYAKIVEVVGNINDSLYEAFKSWWGIHSPADKHAPFVGENIVLGVLKKMGSMKREIKATGDEVNEAIYRSLTPDKARLGELLEMDRTIIPPSFDPTYSRGVDRSELIALSAKIDTLIDKMDALARKEQGIYLDGNILVGRTVERMDDALYRRAVNRERGV